MKYIITENSMNKILTDLIESRYEDIKFTRGYMAGTLIGYLPGNNPENEYVLVYEKGEEDDRGSMILWIYENDYDYFSGMIPLSQEQIKKTIKRWFFQKTGKRVNKVNIQQNEIHYN